MVIRFIDCTEKHHDKMNEIIDFLSKYFTSLGIENHKTKITEEHNTIVRMKKDVCDVCSKRFGGYHEAIVQVRTDKRNLTEEELIEHANIMIGDLMYDYRKYFMLFGELKGELVEEIPLSPEVSEKIQKIIQKSKS